MKRKRASPEERLAELERKKKALDARISKERATVRARARKEDTRRKIVAGAIVLEHASRDPKFARALETLLERFVTRPQDRALFELSPRDGEAAPASETAAGAYRAASGQAK